MVDIILYSGGLPVDGRTRLQLLFLFYLLFQQQNALSTVFLLQATPSLFYLITEAYPPFHLLFFISREAYFLYGLEHERRNVQAYGKAVFLLNTCASMGKFYYATCALNP